MQEQSAAPSPAADADRRAFQVRENFALQVEKLQAEVARVHEERNAADARAAAAQADVARLTDEVRTLNDWATGRA